MGDAFLRAFLEEIEQTFSPNIFNAHKMQTKNANVEIEKDFGGIHESPNGKPLGGRADIFIGNLKKNGKESAIIIENKINADDQKSQLARYGNSTEQLGITDYYLVYLTTNGREPSEYSAGEANKSCILSISYKETIANWLANCIKLAAQFPLVRETIIQYYNLVNEITYQETNNSMDEKITNLLLDGINFDLALKLDAEFANTRNKFFEETFVEITMKAAESLGKKLRVYDKVDFSASEVEFGDICTDGYSIVCH